MRYTTLCYLALALAAILRVHSKAVCRFTELENVAIVSAYSTRLFNVTTMKQCLDRLVDRRTTHALVAYNKVTQECCSVSDEFDYTLIPDTDWRTFQVRCP
jgi:hypothetical protein